MWNRNVLNMLWIGLFVLAGPARAHFLWVVTRAEEETTSVRVYFSETASADDPSLLERLDGVKAWALPERRGEEAQPIELKMGEDSLMAELPPHLSRSTVALRHVYGVVTRGGQSFLLNYYAKSYPFALPGTWKAVDDANLLPLEVVPVMNREGLAIKVLWNGKPQEGSLVTIEGPGLEKKFEQETGSDGTVPCRPPEAGLFSIRARHIEQQEGTHDGATYGLVRHYSTLALRFEPPRLHSGATRFPELQRGITSFGGAIVDDDLYIYGGHFGRAHEYSANEQSAELVRINLARPDQWQQLPAGPKLAGLAMVAHRGRLYRVGGFSARNSESEQQDLWSQDAFARFDPAAAAWESLPSLPEPRSSHDAAVLNDTLFVVGGWELRGNESKWHETAWMYDLAAENGSWQPLPSPGFKRRACALAACNNKIYVIGGMEPRGTTMAVEVYDVLAKVWRRGPALPGTGMDGFGCSAFTCGGQLFATTMSGSLLQLAEAGDRWQFAGQLQAPRFFHRLLGWRDRDLVVVGGASMAAGKIKELELFPMAGQPSRTALRAGQEPAKRPLK
jgi:hypothetical protein